jgi:hypothetical protein
MPKHGQGKRTEGARVNAGLWLLIGMAVMIAVIAAVIVEERSRWQPKGRR